LLFEKLIEMLDLSGWNGVELRLAGHSLGAQIVLSLASKFKTDSRASAYKNKLARIALLDHFFSALEKDYLPQSDPECEDWSWWPCSHLWLSEYALDYLLKDIRDNDYAPVIENYRTSAISDTIFADSADEFVKRTVFVEQKLWFYESANLDEKHIAAIPIYMHCMKWLSYGQLSDGAPSCRMSTSELQQKCPISGWRDSCAKRYEQIGDEGAYTTQDFDDHFRELTVSHFAPWIDFAMKFAFEQPMMVLLGSLVTVLFAANICLALRQQRGLKQYEKVAYESDV